MLELQRRGIQEFNIEGGKGSVKLILIANPIVSDNAGVPARDPKEVLERGVTGWRTVDKRKE
jgi:hypothetical protein